jgi:hypothetical protein
MRLELERFLESSSPVMLRDVGQLLTSTCKDRLDRRQREIADSIGRVEREFAANDSFFDEAAPESRAAWASRVHASGSPNSGSAAPSSRSRNGRVDTGSAALVASVPGAGGRKASPRKRTGVMALALVASAALGAWSLRERFAVPAAPSTVAAAPTPVPALRRLSIEAKPAGARVLVNDVLIAGNPAVVSVPNGSVQSIRLELEGYESSERTVVVDADTSLSIELGRETTSAKTTGDLPDAGPSRSRKRDTPAGGLVPAPLAKPSASSVEDKCTPPYYFVDGIKTYKPECI